MHCHGANDVHYCIVIIEIKLDGGWVLVTITFNTFIYLYK